MNFEPQKFFIGLVDFFAVLLPGAVLAYVGKDWAAAQLWGTTSFKLDTAESWVLVLFASYVLGHFANLVGAVLLDTPVYDLLRKRAHWGTVERLARGRPLWRQPLRGLARRLFGDRDEALQQAVRIKARALQPFGAQDAVNAFQWSKVVLSKQHPEALAAVQRFEADSKFFRSFVVVLLVIAALLVAKGRWDHAAVTAALLLLAGWRYIDQRYKSTQQAYWSLMALQSPKTGAAYPPRLGFAGGVVFRRTARGAEYLLVRSRDATQWVLPKGHIEAGESPRRTAVREVREETGQWARVIRWLGDTSFGAASEYRDVRFFLMEAEPAGGELPPAPQDDDRPSRWVSLDAAKKECDLLSETSALLDKAHAAIEAPAASPDAPRRRVRRVVIARLSAASAAKVAGLAVAAPFLLAWVVAWLGPLSDAGSRVAQAGRSPAGSTSLAVGVVLVLLLAGVLSGVSLWIVSRFRPLTLHCEREAPASVAHGDVEGEPGITADGGPVGPVAAKAGP